ncbi:MAG TPA: peptidase U62, partial [Porphyromonadaceae bacterium]|nr:peptidase U62 [Porphyromonadaceae bacterium]
MRFNRRNFIKAGGIMLGSLAAPSMFGNGNNNGASTNASVMNFAMEHFGVTDSDLKKVLSAALEKGGNYADLFFEHTFSNSISLQDGAVNRAYSNIDFGMGVRVVAGDQTGYAYVENITLEEMLNAARTAARIATGTGAPAPVNLTEIKVKNQLYKIKTTWEDVPVKSKMPYLQKINDQMFEADKRITKVSAWLNDNTSHILFCNSEGQYYYDYRPM